MYLDFSYLCIDFGSSTVKNRLNFLLHEVRIVAHPHEDLSQIPLRLEGDRGIQLLFYHIMIVCPLSYQSCSIMVFSAGHVADSR